jgi:hypothetical protein
MVQHHHPTFTATLSKYNFSITTIPNLNIEKFDASVGVQIPSLKITQQILLK